MLALTLFLALYLLQVWWYDVVPTAIERSRLRSGGAHCDLALTVTVEEDAEDEGGGPAGQSLIKSM